MKIRCLGRGLAALAATSLAIAPALALVQPKDPRHPKWLDPRPVEPRMEPSGRAAADDLARLALTGSWEVRVDPRTGKPTFVAGSGVPLYPGKGNDLPAAGRRALDDAAGEIDLRLLEPAARAFLAERPALLPARGELVLDERAGASRREGRLVSLYFQWTVDGVPVDGARVFLRANHGNVTQFGSVRIGEIALDTRPKVSAAQAFDRLLDYAGHAEVADAGDRVEEPRLLIQPEDRGAGRLDYRLVWELRYRVPGRIETWAGRVDAETGDVVSFVDANAYAHAVGGVYPRSVLFENETRVPFQELSVLDNGVARLTDSAGAYSYTGLDAETSFGGRWFDVSCQACSNPAQPLVFSDTGTGRLDFGFGLGDQVGNGFSTTADRNAFYHANYARQVGLKWLPSETWFQTQGFGLRTNIAATCNATYDGSNLNLYNKGGNCNNTALVADIVYHEYGHGIDQNTLGGDGGTGEGTADVVSMHMTLSPLVGPGFRLSGDPVRDLDSATSSLGVHTASQADAICGGGVHCRGQVLGQTAWDLANALVADHGYYTGWRTAERLFFTSLPDQGSYLSTSPDSIYEAYIQADDDNGNLTDGTPNADAIHTAFDRHEIARAPYPNSAACARPAQPVAAATPACDSLEISWDPVPGVDRYEILRAELFEGRAYLPVATIPAGGATSWTDTELMQGIDYFYQVMAVAPDGCESTVESPVAGALTPQPELSVVGATTDDVPAGNRSGFADPGEDVDLRIELGNFGTVEAPAAGGLVLALTPGVTMLENAPAWGALPAEGSGVNTAVVRFTTDPGQVACGDELRFRYIPSEGTGCSDDISYFSVRLGEPDGQGGFVCDDTPACFAPATFDGLDTATPGASCAETALDWEPAASNCINAEITYNVYRDTAPGFAPTDANRVAAGLTATEFDDSLLQPGQTYHYVVRAFDSRSGEETNAVEKTVVSPTTPDIAPPVFDGLSSVAAGASCGETVVTWDAALETCNAPVTYEVHRSTDPLFVPGPSTLVGSTLTPGFVDAALTPDQEYTYVVRARDTAGNEAVNDLRGTVAATIADDVRFRTPFEIDDAGWQVVAPNDAIRGNWEWGDPELGASQPADDASDPGVNCWMTGLPETLPDGNNNDIDGGETTLQSAVYDLTGAIDPVARFAFWFSNAQGAAPGEDSMTIDVSNDGGESWVNLAVVAEDRDFWVPAQYALNGVIAPTDSMVFRFRTGDLNAGSLVDAGIDEFELADRDRGCQVCALPAQKVGTILLGRSGSDVTIDWTADPVDATRYAVYALSGPDFSEAVRIGTTSGKTFVHEGAGELEQAFAYRVSAVDGCGNESALD